MAHDLDEALGYLLDEEGGWSNNKNDRGGATMYGITQGTYTQWRKDKKKAPTQVRNITQDEARELYRELYWNAAGCDKLAWPISYMVFDGAVNSGPSRSVRWLQAALGLPLDGKVGPKTTLAAQQVVDAGDGKKILAILDQRVAFLARLVQASNSQATFLLGWWRRTLRVLARSLLSEPAQS